MEHTPTPWRLARRSEYDPLTVIETEDDYIADCTEQVGDDRDEINAAFIVRAVNAHDDLVAALELVAQRCGPNSDDGAIARAALAKATA